MVWQSWKLVVALDATLLWVIGLVVAVCIYSEELSFVRQCFASSNANELRRISYFCFFLVLLHSLHGGAFFFGRSRGAYCFVLHLMHDGGVYVCVALVETTRKMKKKGPRRPRSCVRVQARGTRRTRRGARAAANLECNHHCTGGFVCGLNTLKNKQTIFFSLYYKRPPRHE